MEIEPLKQKMTEEVINEAIYEEEESKDEIQQSTEAQKEKELPEALRKYRSELNMK